MTLDMFLWTEKYRPHTIIDTILPTDLRATFQSFVDSGQIPNLLLCGPPGVGKTTIAKAMVDELQSEFHVINGSLNGNIDTLRNEISQFASAVSLNGKRKYVILDEADYLNPNSFQPALRNFMEEFAANTGFILTCNYKSRIIDPLHSRCTIIDFRITKDHIKDVGNQIYARITSILKTENIAYDKAALIEVIKRFFPDMRRMLNQLQGYAGASGKIDVGILSQFTESRLGKLLEAMKAKKFSDVRTWITDNNDLEDTEIYRKFYDVAYEHFTPESVPVLVWLLGDYQYKAAFAADRDINTAACMALIMKECTFK